MRLTGRVALVTGASRGIGRASALALAREGAAIVAAARTAADLESLVNAIVDLGGKALAVPTDVTQASAVKTCVEDAIGAHGRIDILVNNAGVGGYRPFLEWSE